MATFYGRNSSYLLKNDAKYYFLAVGLAMLPLLVIGALYQFSNPATIGIGALILIFFLVKASEPLVNYLKAKSGKYYRGWSGELDVKRELQKLPEDYSVYEDVRIGQGKGNLDFVVVGPGGVFILEVKSHAGNIGFNGHGLP